MSADMKRSEASTYLSRMDIWRSKASRTLSASRCLSSPLFTKTQVSLSPMARCMSEAATAESTPPDRAHMTLPSPTCRRMDSTDSATKLPGVQPPEHPHTSIRKLRMIRPPSSVWTTSG